MGGIKLPITLRIVLIVITVIYLLMLIRKLKTGALQLSFSIFWIFTGLFLVVIAVFPIIVQNISGFFGFQTTANMLFLITIFIAYYLIFELTLKLSQENKKNTALVQEISLLKRRVEIMEKNNKEI